MTFIEKREVGRNTYYLDRLSDGSYTIERDGTIIERDLEKDDAVAIFYNLK